MFSFHKNVNEWIISIKIAFTSQHSFPLFLESWKVALCKSTRYVFLKCSVDDARNIKADSLPRRLIEDINSHCENVGKAIPDYQVVDSRSLLFSYHNRGDNVHQGGDGQKAGVWPKIGFRDTLVDNGAIQLKKLEATSQSHRWHWLSRITMCRAFGWEQILGSCNDTIINCDSRRRK